MSYKEIELIYILWIGVRVVIALACLYTIQTVIHWHGYWIPFSHMVIIGIVALIAIRMMLPWNNQ